MRDFTLPVAAAVGLALILATLFGGGGEYRPVPACEEDEVIVGVGEFEGGRWDHYVCGPALDDLTLRD